MPRIVALALLLAAAIQVRADTPPPEQPAAVKQACEELTRHAALSAAERATLAQRGRVAVYFPVGGDDRGLFADLRSLGMLDVCQFLDGRTIAGGALDGCALLILPDLDSYGKMVDRDDRIKAYLSGGGGVYATGSAVAYLHGMGIFNAKLVPFRARGNVATYVAGWRDMGPGKPVPAIYGEASSLMASLMDQKLASGYALAGLTAHAHDGPLFELPADSPLRVAAFAAFTRTPGTSVPEVPGMAYGPIGKGRLALCAVGRSGVTSKDNPTNAELPNITTTTLSDLRDPSSAIVQKNLLLYAAGVTPLESGK